LDKHEVTIFSHVGCSKSIELCYKYVENLSPIVTLLFQQIFSFSGLRRV